MQKNKEAEKNQSVETILAQKPGTKVKSPYMSRKIYENYAKGMKTKNQKRRKEGLEAITIRTFEEWSGN